VHAHSLVAEENVVADDRARGQLDLTPNVTGLLWMLGRPSILCEELVKLDYLHVTYWSLVGTFG
jgi:hypothetical protein